MRQSSFKVIKIVTTDQNRSRVQVQDVSYFEALLQQNGGDFLLGRKKNTVLREQKPVRFANDVIAEMGNNTYYYMGDEVWLYVADSTKTKIYYKKEGDNGWTEVELSTLDHTTAFDGETTIYDVSSLMANAGKYYFTTDTDLNQKCELLRVNTGTITVSGDQVTISGFSANLTPLYYSIFEICPGSVDSTKNPAPEGYYARRVVDSSTMIENGETTFTVEWPDETETVKGYYIRFYYKNEFGKAQQNSKFYKCNGEEWPET